MTVRLDRVQLACIAWVSAATDATGLWAPSLYPRSPGTDSAVVTFRLVSGPNLVGARTLYSDEPTALVWTMGTPTVDSLVGFNATGAQWVTEAASLTATQIRDALYTQLSASSRLLPGVTIASVSTNQISFSAGGVPGLLWSAGAIGPGTSLAVSSSVDCEIATGRADLVLDVQAFATGPSINAHSVMADLIGAQKSQDFDAIKSQFGVVIGGPIGEVVDLTQQAGADWESRCAVRISASLRTYRALATESIETVSGSISEGSSLFSPFTFEQVTP